jgi:hypothetical protein
MFLLGAVFLLSFGQASLYSAFPLFAESELEMTAGTGRAFSFFISA